MCQKLCHFNLHFYTKDTLFAKLRCLSAIFCGRRQKVCDMLGRITGAYQGRHGGCSTLTTAGWTFYRPASEGDRTRIWHHGIPHAKRSRHVIRTSSTQVVGCNWNQSFGCCLFSGFSSPPNCFSTRVPTRRTNLHKSTMGNVSIAPQLRLHMLGLWSSYLGKRTSRNT